MQHYRTRMVKDTMEIKKFEDFDEKTKRLLIASAEARKKAYAPYSKFFVGAAIKILGSEEIITGCNVENVSYGLTFCAERTAIVKAVSEERTKFEAVAVAAVSGDYLVSPCGACRQFLAEFSNQVNIYVYNPQTKKVGVTSLIHLLPEAFTPSEACFYDVNANGNAEII